MLDFGVGWSEILLIGIVALVVIGPKELPGALRTLGQWMGKIRRMASEFQSQFQEAMREAEIDQLKKDMDDMASKAQSYTAFDPIAEMRTDIEKTIGDPPSLDQPATSAPDVATAPPAPDTPATHLPVTTPEAPPPAAESAASDPAIADLKPEAGRGAA